MTSEALSANTLFQLVAVEQQSAKPNEKAEYVAVIRLLENHIKNGDFKVSITDLRVSKDKIETIKDLLTEVIGKGKLLLWHSCKIQNKGIKHTLRYGRRIET